MQGGGLLTPQTEGRIYSDYGHGYRVPGSYPGSFEVSPGQRMSASTSASAKAKAQMMEEDEIDNPGIRRVSSFTDRLRRASGGGHEQQRQRQEKLDSFFSKQDSPRKTPRTANVTSPGKRKRGSDIEDDDDDEALQTQRAMEQTTPTRKRLSDPLFSFSSPLQSLPQSQSFDICQTPTPTKYTNPLTTTTSMIQSSPSNSQPGATATTLAHQAITLLENKGVVIARSTQEELAALLNRHEMKMQGVIRGRDVSRMALKKREEEVEWLRERVDGLEVELKRTTGE